MSGEKFEVTILGCGAAVPMAVESAHSTAC